MPTARRMLLTGALYLAACTTQHQAADDSATVDSVRAFMADVARGVTTGGPAAWRGFFVDDSTFFMASEGRLVFPSSAAATRGIDQLKQLITRIELSWSDTVRVDPLAPGLAVVAAPYREGRVDRQGHLEEIGFFTGIAERHAGRWVLRDAHWSVQTPPASIP